MIDSDHNKSHAEADPTPEMEVLRKKMHQAQESLSQAQMPQYLCHKKVWALKIKQIYDPAGLGEETDGSRMIVPEEAGYAPFRVDVQYVLKHRPSAGGYYVVYDDGYKSFSPAEPFEQGYSKLP